MQSEPMGEQAGPERPEPDQRVGSWGRVSPPEGAFSSPAAATSPQGFAPRERLTPERRSPAARDKSVRIGEGAGTLFPRRLKAKRGLEGIERDLESPLLEELGQRGEELGGSGDELGGSDVAGAQADIHESWFTKFRLSLPPREARVRRLLHGSSTG